MASIRAEFWVDDVSRAVDYYERVLGFKRGRVSQPREGGPATYGEVHFGDSNPLAFASTQGSGPGLVRAVIEKLAQGGPKGAGVVVLIDVGEMDIDRYYAELTRKGVKLVEPLEDKPYGARMFRIEDPDGYILSFSKRLS